MDLDDHHEEAMRGESNWTSGDGGDGEWAPEDDGADVLGRPLDRHRGPC